MRSLALPALLVAVLACAAPAVAAGPVFVVLSDSATAQPPAAAPGPLARARERQQAIASALSRARELAASSPLLSDRLDAEKDAFQLGTSEGVAAGSVDRIETHLAALAAHAARPDPVAAAQAEPAAPAYDPFLVPQASGVGVRAVTNALQYLGVPYVWGGADPATGFDCSGLVQYVYAQLGVTLAHFAGTQLTEGAPVPEGQLRPGDLVFFEPGVAGPGHVGIYAGGDEFVEAPHTGAVVRVSSLSLAKQELGYVGAVRPYGVAGAYGALGF